MEDLRKPVVIENPLAFGVVPRIAVLVRVRSAHGNIAAAESPHVFLRQVPDWPAMPLELSMAAPASFYRLTCVLID